MAYGTNDGFFEVVKKDDLIKSGNLNPIFSLKIQNENAKPGQLSNLCLVSPNIISFCSEKDIYFFDLSVNAIVLVQRRAHDATITAMGTGGNRDATFIHFFFFNLIF